jgi:acyl-CoA dehydrogenase
MPPGWWCAAEARDQAPDACNLDIRPSKGDPVTTVAHQCNVPEQIEAFSERCRSFFDSHAELRVERDLRWGLGPDTVPIFESPDDDEERAQLAVARAWQAALFDAGLAWIEGPVEYGGAGLTAAHQQAFDSVAAGYRAPNLYPLFIGLHIVTAGLLAGASEEIKRDLLPKIYRADVIACQLFSEPGAGSDLAAVATRARRDGDTWRIDGQKVWTSGGHFSDVGLLLARTGDDPVPHRRLTMFTVDMRAPGVDVRRLREMGGGAHFNEVFLDTVQVPDTHRVSEIGAGWVVAMATLGGERKAVGDSADAPNAEVVRRLVELARRIRDNGGGLDDAARDAVMRCVALGQALDRTAERLSSGEGPTGPELSVVKLLRNRLLRSCTDTAGSLLGPAMVADTGVWGSYAWGRAATLAPGLRIGGGTDEIQRTILAERVLGLPKEPKLHQP